jgi:hypothetical protein
MADRTTIESGDDRLMEQQTDDAMGEADPKTPEALLGEDSFGDGAAVNAEQPKIVDSPSNSVNGADPADTTG